MAVFIEVCQNLCRRLDVSTKREEIVLYRECLNTFYSETETVRGSVHSALVALG